MKQTDEQRAMLEGSERTQTNKSRVLDASDAAAASVMGFCSRTKGEYMRTPFNLTTYDVKKTADLLQRSPNYVWRLVKQKKIEAVKTRPIRIGRYAIQNYLIDKYPILEKLFKRI